MSLLASNTLANPYNSFYALASAGPAPVSSLQSPVDLIPEAGGNQNLNIVASTGTGEASVLIASDVANANVALTLSTVGQGNANILMGDVAAPGGTSAVAIVYPGAAVGGGQLQIQNQNGNPYAVFDTIGNAVLLGNGLTAGLTTVKNGLKVSDEFVTNDRTGIGLTATAPNVGVIAMTSPSGVLNLGSGTQNPDIIKLIDGGSPDSAGCIIGANGGLSVQIQGGTVASPAATIFTDANGGDNGALSIGSSAAVNNTIQLSDTGGAAGTGVASVAGTVFSTGTVALSTVVGTAIIQVPGQGGVGQNPVALTITPTLTTIGSPKLAARVPGTYNGGLDGLYTYFAVINSTGSGAGVVGNTGVQIPPPSNGTPAAIGDQSLEGLYQVSLVTSNASTDIYSKLAQITTQSYWNPASGWFGGSGGASTFGGAEFRAGINPSNVIAAGQLWVTNTSGNNWTGMSARYVQLTGVIPNWYVA
jgi:hypothetical protein